MEIIKKIKIKGSNDPFDIGAKASNVIDSDGKSFQAKLDAGTLKGPKGPDGNPGKPGPVGDPGPVGPQGDKGPTGDRGPTGGDGLQGQKGPRGDQGNKGPTGDRGPGGDKGPRGDQGKQGPQGEPGPHGLTTTMSVNGNTYTQVNGSINLPDYLTIEMISWEE